MSGGQTIFNMTAWLGADITEFQSKMNAAKTQSDLLKDTLSDLKSTLIGAFAVGGVVEFTKSCLEAYDKQAQAEIGLKTALKGRLDIYEDLKSFATDWQFTGTVDKEQIMNQEKYLASLGFTEDRIKEVISASLQLSAVTGGSLDESVKGLTKSYTGALSKELSRIPGLKDLTKAELEHGAAVELVNKNMAGMAQAAGGAGLSSVTHMNEAITEMKTAIGEWAGSGISKAGERITLFFRTLTAEGVTTANKLKFIFNWDDLWHYDKAKVKASFEEMLQTAKTVHDDMQGKLQFTPGGALGGIPSLDMAAYARSQNQGKKDSIKLLYGQEADNQELPKQLSILDQIKKDIADITDKRNSSDKAKEVDQYNEQLSKLNIKLLEHESIIGRIKDKITELTEARAQSTDLTQIASYNDKLKEQEEYLKRINSITSQDLEDRKNPLTPIKPIAHLDLSHIIKNDVDKPSAAGIPTSSNTQMDIVKKNWADFMHDLNLTIDQGLDKLVETAASGLGELAFTFISGGNVGNAMKSIGATLLSGLASIINSLGQQLMVLGGGILAVHLSLAYMQPEIAFAAALACFAIAGGIAAWAKSVGSGGSSSSGGVGSIASSSWQMPQIGMSTQVAGMGNQMQNVVLTATVKGNDLALTSARGQNIRSQKY